MRFVRAYTDPSGEVVFVLEQEVPFLDGHKVTIITADKVATELQAHELGLAEDFTPTDAETGAPCKPAAHIFLRIARDRASGAFTAKPGHELPAFLDCPTSLGGIKARLAARGPDSISAKARAWLALMLPPDQVEAMGIGRGIPISTLKALDEMRQRRDPSVGSRRVRYEREAQALSDERTAAALKRNAVIKP